MPYDPKACGARCDDCVLSRARDSAPVAPERHGSPILVVSDYPGDDEVMVGRPLVGRGGQELMRAIGAVGVHRQRLDYTHAVACRPVGGNWKKVQAEIAKENRRRKREGLEPQLDPVACCAPRLHREMAAAAAVIPLGKLAYEAVVPEHVGDDGKPRKHPSVDRVMGNLAELRCTDGVVRKVVAALHPKYVNLKKRWVGPFRAAISRAIRWFDGKLVWQEPSLQVMQRLDQLDAIAAWVARQPYVLADVETNALEPELADLRCIQIGTVDTCVIIPVKSCEGPGFRSFWTLPEEIMLAQRMAEILQSTLVVGHNFGSYDRMALSRWFRLRGVAYECVPDLDTILLHRDVDPDLPHGLDFLGSTYTDVHAWKADHTAVTAKTDAELWRYGGLDVVVNARVLAPMVERYFARLGQRVMPAMQPLGVPLEPASPAPQLTILRRAAPNYGSPAIGMPLYQDHQMQAVCVEMHRTGILIDQDKRKKHETAMREQETLWVDRVQTALADAGLGHMAGFDKKGEPIFNPRSPDALRHLFFDVWELPPPEHLNKLDIFTDSGDRRASDTIMRAYLADASLPPEWHRVIHAIRRAKKFRTWLGRFVEKLVPWNERPPDAEFLAVWPDGRLRVNWNVHRTGVGRLSSGGRPSRINLQTIPSFLRDMFVASEGHVFVASDLAAIHLRLIANLWKIPSLLSVFDNENVALPPDATPMQRAASDPHATLALLIFGDRFINADGWPSPANNFEWSGPAKGMRQVAKALRYAGAYGASVPTIHATMTRSEDKDGNLTNRHLTLDMVRAYYESWMGKEPEWRRAWDTEVDLYRQHGFLLSPLLGRRGDFLDAGVEDRNKLINFRILSGEADIMGPATVKARNRIPPGRWSPQTGLVGQFHDQLVFEVPVDARDETMRVLDEAMMLDVPGWPVKIIGEPKWGHDWTLKPPKQVAA